MAAASAGLLVQPALAREVPRPYDRGMDAGSIPDPLKASSVTENLGAKVDPDLTFTGQDGRPVRLGDYFANGKPTLLTLNYYGCKMLCSLVLNALTTGLEGVDWTPGEKFNLVTVSIDPREKPELAAGKRASHLGALGRSGASWDFLTGEDPAIKTLAATVGFNYAYDANEDQYSHPAAIFFLSPDGTVSRYLYGIQFSPRDIKFALMEAADGRLGSPVEKILLSCFHYDASAGNYSPVVMKIMRLGGAVMVALAVALVLILRRRHPAAARAEVHA